MDPSQPSTPPERAAPTPPDHAAETPQPGTVPTAPGRSILSSGWWVGLAGVLIGLLGLGAAFWALRDQSDVTQPVPLVRDQGGTAGLGTVSAATASGLSGMQAQGEGGAGRSALLDVTIPTGFAPPQLQNLSFADAFAQAAAYRGWRCTQTEVILFSDVRQALPAVQERLVELGYQVSDTPPALGEDRSWLARHAERPDLFGSFSSGEEGRGNVSLCVLAG